ncbi:wdr89 [Acrasis kona]|uniref:Wdr89 n=1 Tax=Acrasis kona TaxID=1008807 RepID=A0AAW2ZKA0_9EUKA
MIKNVSSVCFSNDDRNLVTCNQGGEVQLWDMRVPNSALTSRDIEMGELYSLDVLENYYAVSGENTIVVGDLRKNMAPVQKLVNIHTMTIRNVKFTSTHLISGADDGLVHVYDINNLSEDGLSSVINVDTGINRLGLIGDALWTITHTHELQFWNRSTCLQVGTTINRSTFETPTSSEWDHYVINATSHGDELLLAVGNHQGSVTIHKVGIENNKSISSPISEPLTGGHDDDVLVRAIWIDLPQVDRVITAGEDGKACIWRGGSSTSKSKKKKNFKPY